MKSRSLLLVGLVLVTLGCVAPEHRPPSPTPQVASTPSAFDQGEPVAQPSVPAPVEPDLLGATRQGDLALVKLLIERGANANAPTAEDGVTAVMEAAAGGHEQIARLLLEHGADVNGQTTERNTTALILAAEQGHVGLVELVLNHKARPNEARTDGETALTLAAWYGYQGVVEALLRHGASVNAKTAEGETPLFIAQAEHHEELAAMLRKRGGIAVRGPRTAPSPEGPRLMGQITQDPIDTEVAPQRIQAVVRNDYGRIRTCYEQGLHGCPNLEGRISIRFVIGRDGTVTKARDNGSDLPDAAVVQCVVRAVRGLTFPRPKQPVTVEYPIMFSPG